MSEKAGLFLKKANDDLVSHCKCEPFWISAPAQMDCPWCGCGWLFACPKCRRAYTFAVAAACDLTWEELAHLDLDTRYSEPPSDEDVDLWIEYMKQMTEDLEEGQQYVYLDGWAIPVDAEEFDLEGVYADHQLECVPQAAALHEPSIIEEVLANEDYWHERHVEYDDEDEE
ncbi:hypothetical protein C5Y96_06650 [Blastopirellula marina]|uniref:Uncharacterized protein n=1 Tax=Blastopirellula marina TaxID=124 RepID=A0A2S8FXP4_9BACT|nr:MULTISPECIES: hypothetical protein [Pirellulaceae]PQO36840.1 hypothetical protein C5Y96_06650 [Blastopirellula marina]RCS53555.1 hypothetical protein DTL36_06660 [Bremerella cremea]